MKISEDLCEDIQRNGRRTVEDQCDHESGPEAVTTGPEAGPGDQNQGLEPEARTRSQNQKPEPGARTRSQNQDQGPEPEPGSQELVYK